MKQNNFGWILWLMALSTLALLGMQAYWLRQQYLQQQAGLHRDAFKAMSEVNNEINRRNSFVTQPNNERTYDFQHWNADSSRVFIFASNISDQVAQPDTHLQRMRRQQAQAILAEINQHPTDTDTTILETIVFRSVQQCANCESGQSLATRYPLDQMIKQALQQQGIGLTFALGLKPFEGANWNYLSPADTDANALLQSPLSLPLLGKKEVLYLYFPDQNNWILAHLGRPFVASACLLLIIFGSFFYAWRIIRQQKKLSEMKNDFINNMTHEFKTPIATIAFAAANINNEQILSQPQQIIQFTRIISDENRRLNEQVEKVLQAALADRKAFDLNWQEIELASVLKPVWAAASLRIAEKQGHFDLHTDEATGLFLWADAFHLCNIVNNLLDNAIKYTASHQPPQVSFRIQRRQEGILMTVADRGMGISRDDLPFVFDKFYRGHTGNLHNIKGFGLGLSYVKGIATQMGGSVRVESRLGEGSTFFLFLPYHTKPVSHA